METLGGEICRSSGKDAAPAHALQPANSPILVQQGHADRTEEDGGSACPANVYLDSTVISASSLSSFLRLQPEGRDACADERVIFFDLDNTLYSKRTGIAEEMGHRIQLYFQTFLHLPEEESRSLGQRYYLDYGLAIKGLVRNFQIDPAEYDRFVDGGLRLEEALGRDEALRALLARITARRWVFTNAGREHALRVLRLLQIDEFFEGIVYCDYAEPDFPAKPDRLAYERAMMCAGVAGRPDLCYFVDDSISNVRTAGELGWTAVHLDERHEPAQEPPVAHPAIAEISSLRGLEDAFAGLFGRAAEPH